MLLLGIETSCDETAAAVVQDGTRLLSSVVASQIAVHHPYGGVVPELASRKHLEAIVVVVQSALEQAGIGKSDIDAVAVTQGPGLVGALLVGFSFAKAYAFTLGLPLVGVNHLQGHINSVFLEPDPPPFPFVALLVSGGHTGIYHVESHCRMRLLGQTRDDAAGEAFDKVAKMLGLGYPGGVVIEEMAHGADPHRIAFPRIYLDKTAFDFSFSGLKTAVRRYLETHGFTTLDGGTLPPELESQIPDIVAGFQEAVVDVLVYKLLTAARHTGCSHAVLVGGVAANRSLRERLRTDASDVGVNVCIPPLKLCGDNAAMIAATGFHLLKKGRTVALADDVFSRAQLKGRVL